MLFVLGVGSLMALVNAVATAIWDQFQSKLKYYQIVIPISMLGFLSGLLYITPGGQWLINLVDFFGGTFVVFVLAIAELIGFFWIYGLERFCDDVEFMLDRRPSFYWKLCWGIITPVLMIVIFIYSIITMETLQYNRKDYPEGFLSKWDCPILTTTNLMANLFSCRLDNLCDRLDPGAPLVNLCDWCKDALGQPSEILAG